MKRLEGFFQSLATSPFLKAEWTLFSELTDREREALILMAQGKNNQEIVRELFISQELTDKFAAIALPRVKSVLHRVKPV